MISNIYHAFEKNQENRTRNIQPISPTLTDFGAVPQHFLCFHSKHVVKECCGSEVYYRFVLVESRAILHNNSHKGDIVKMAMKVQTK